jgi:hypothetical protein
MCFAADGVIFKDALVICTVERVSDAQTTYTRLSLPFKVYGQNVVCLGKDVTYSLDKLADKTEVLAKVDYKEEDEALVNAYGTITKKDAPYLKHYSTKKADALATWNPITETLVKYSGADKDELADFCVRCK